MPVIKVSQSCKSARHESRSMMKVSLISVGTRMPQWVQLGVAEYQKRIANELGFKVIEVPMMRRGKSQSVAQCVEKEGLALLQRVQPADFVVSLDVTGTVIDTATLARRIEALRLESLNLSLLVGGPDGLSEQCQRRANESWSLSALTLPHPLVRVLVAEQFYRANSILKGHPYHRQ